MFILFNIVKKFKNDKKSIADLENSINDNEIATGDIESIYIVVCEEFSVEGKGHTTLWKYLKRLEDREILASRLSTVNQGRRRTQFFSMPAALPADIERRLETLIPARLRR